MTHCLHIQEVSDIGLKPNWWLYWCIARKCLSACSHLCLFDQKLKKSTRRSKCCPQQYANDTMQHTMDSTVVSSSTHLLFIFPLSSLGFFKFWCRLSPSLPRVNTPIHHSGGRGGGIIHRPRPYPMLPPIKEIMGESLYLLARVKILLQPLGPYLKNPKYTISLFWYSPRNTRMCKYCGLFLKECDQVLGGHRPTFIFSTHIYHLPKCVIIANISRHRFLSVPLMAVSYPTYPLQIITPLPKSETGSISDVI